MPGQPALARSDQDRDRFYEWDGERYYSVSTIISGGVPKYLLAWAAKAVAEVAHDDLAALTLHARARAQLRRWTRAGRADVLAKQADGGLTSIKLGRLSDRDLALRWLKGAPERIREEAAQKGRDFHDEAELEILRLANEAGELAGRGRAVPSWPAHLSGHRDSFLRFLDWAEPTYLMTEATIFNRTQAYAGTLDAGLQTKRVLTPAGERAIVCVDYKSGNDVYAEVALQLAAYTRGEFVGLKDGATTAPMPAFEAGLVLHVTPRRFRPRLIRIDDEVFRAFLHAREVFRFRKQIAPTVFLQDLTPLEETA